MIAIRAIRGGKRWLTEMIAQGQPVRRIDGTNLALLDVCPDGSNQPVRA
jgi:hypothetical protein